MSILGGYLKARESVRARVDHLKPAAAPAGAAPRPQAPRRARRRRAAPAGAAPRPQARRAALSPRHAPPAQSYFKTEQEAQLQNHRARLVKDGKLGAAAAAASRERSFDESEALFEVGAEVLAAQARVDDPGAAARQRHDVRGVKGAPPPPSAEDVRRARAGAGSVGALAVGRVSLSGRDRYGLARGAAAAAAAGGELDLPAARRLSPEAALGPGGAGALRARARAWAEPLGAGARAWAEPAGARLRAWLAPAAGAGAAGGIQARLQERYSSPAARPPHRP
jgi:hypothetical protein